MSMPEGPHRDLLDQALAAESEAQRLLLDGRDEEGRALLIEAADAYRRSWELAPPASYGRLIGMLKAAVIAGDATDAARFAIAELPDPPPSPPAAYALALAHLVLGEDVAAAAATSVMREGSEAFGRTAAAIVALARRDATGYGHAVAAIVEDFEGRDAHLTGVPIADTALMLQRLAAPRGVEAGLSSTLLP